MFEKMDKKTADRLILHHLKDGTQNPEWKDYDN